LNKKIIRALVFIIAFLMIVLCLAGCNGKTNQSATATPSTEPTKNGGGGPNDLGGRTVRVLYWMVQPGEGAAPFADMGQEGVVMTQRIEEIQNNYNCKIQWVGDGTTHQAWDAMHKSILIGKPITDIAMVGNEHVIQAFEKGGLYTVLNDYADEIELNNQDLWDQKQIEQLFTLGGMTLAVAPAMSGIEQVFWGSICFFNKTMLERENLWNDYNLYEMQMNKTWTWAKMEEIAEKVVKDLNGDGVTDQYGLIYNAHTHVGLNASNSDGNYYGFFDVDPDGKAVFRGREPARMAVMELFYNAGKAGKGWLHIIDVPGQGPNEASREFFAAGNSAFIIDYGNQIQNYKELGMQDTIGAVAVPMGPDNTVNEYFLARQYYKPWIIPRNIENTEQIALVMKELCKPLYTLEEMEIGIEATLSDYIGGESQIIDTYIMMGHPDRGANCMESPFIATWAAPIASFYGSFGALINGEIDPRGLNEMWGDQVQQTMNDYWAKVLEGVERMQKKRKEAGLA